MTELLNNGSRKMHGPISDELPCHLPEQEVTETNAKPRVDNRPAERDIDSFSVVKYLCDFFNRKRD